MSSHYGKIKPPGKRFGKRLQHSKVFGHGAHGKKSGFADLLITPLVDMFVIIVLFLIANFSATGEVLGMTKDIELPTASNVKEIQHAEVVMVSGKEILLSGQSLITIPELLADSENAHGPIPKLQEMLQQKKIQWEQIHRSAGDTTEFPGDINIQAHKDVEFAVIKRVMMSCYFAGFGNMNYAVIQKGGAPEEGGETAAVTP